MENFRIHSWLPLNNNPSWIMCSVHWLLSLRIGFSDASYASLKSGSSIYISLRLSKPKVLTLNSCISKHFPLRALATLLAVPEICLITKILHVFNPFNMFLVQLLLSSHELQSVIITVQNELLGNQIVSPFLQRLYDCVEFLVIRGVINLHFIQFFTEVCDRPVILAQDRSN